MKIYARPIVFLLVALSGDTMSKASFGGAGGTLAIFIPTNAGLVIAADKRQSPKGIFCDGINKILIPHRPARTAVVITGNITLSEMPDLPPAELCKFLASTPAPIDFGRTTLAFLNSENVSLARFDGQRFAEVIYGELEPYISGGKLSTVFGTRVAQIIIADFDPSTTKSSLLALGIDLDSAGRFQLQPLPVTSSTTVSGTSFDLQSDRVVLPFGEASYLYQYVFNGPGQALLNDDYSRFLSKQKVAQVDLELASSVSLNLIEATSKTTEAIPAPSGIGGGASAVLIGGETVILR